MTVKAVPAGRALTGRPARQIIGRSALAAVGVSFFTISISTHGADLGTRYSTALAVPSQPASPGRAHPRDAMPDRSAQRARMVDQLYEELMRWTPPGCLSTATKASGVAGC
jgi:hypothetical protein